MLYSDRTVCPCASIALQVEMEVEQPPPSIFPEEDDMPPWQPPPVHGAGSVQIKATYGGKDPTVLPIGSAMRHTWEQRLPTLRIPPEMLEQPQVVLLEVYDAGVRLTPDTRHPTPEAAQSAAAPTLGDLIGRVEMRLDKVSSEPEFEWLELQVLCRHA